MLAPNLDPIILPSILRQIPFAGWQCECDGENPTGPRPPSWSAESPVAQPQTGLDSLERRERERAGWRTIDCDLPTIVFVRSNLGLRRRWRPASTNCVRFSFNLGHGNSHGCLLQLTNCLLVGGNRILSPTSTHQCFWLDVLRTQNLSSSRSIHIFYRCLHLFPFLYSLPLQNTKMTDNMDNIRIQRINFFSNLSAPGSDKSPPWVFIIFLNIPLHPSNERLLKKLIFPCVRRPTHW